MPLRKVADYGKNPDEEETGANRDRQVAVNYDDAEPFGNELSRAGPRKEQLSPSPFTGPATNAPHAYEKIVPFRRSRRRHMSSRLTPGNRCCRKYVAALRHNNVVAFLCGALRKKERAQQVFEPF